MGRWTADVLWESWKNDIGTWEKDLKRNQKKQHTKIAHFKCVSGRVEATFPYLSRFGTNQLMTGAIPPTIPYCIPGGRSSRHRLCRCEGPQKPSLLDLLHCYTTIFWFFGSWWLICNSSNCRWASVVWHWRFETLAWKCVSQLYTYCTFYGGCSQWPWTFQMNPQPHVSVRWGMDEPWLH